MAGHVTAVTMWAPPGLGEVSPGDDLGLLIGDLLAGVQAQAAGAGAACTEPNCTQAGCIQATGGEGRCDEARCRALNNSRASNCCRSSDSNWAVAPGDIVCVTSKIVSKAEGRVLAAADREQAITDQTVRLVAQRDRPPLPDGTEQAPLRIVENPLGLVMAAAGVDASNTPEGTVLLLPEDPDASARKIRAALQARFGLDRLGVIITDTVGRPWREGLVDIAIGSAGVDVVDDLRGAVDAHGRPLTVTVTAVIDQVAAASELVRGKTTGTPVALVRGLGRYVWGGNGSADSGARLLVRDSATDMFREGSDIAYARGYADALAGRKPSTRPV